ncbi:uncharacterized protein LOC115627394 [Scaptodrosophila lebanonensis]|uniref:pyridoxal 5'-phosphate synthase n=1 Tax=Drosophila lebanonensis TaxID=7225 RepID=A0A6J2TUS8_DROLE|nr:uncharacterized protein LOC115627394 [Scaptodrosophila lebanonensis]
MPQTMNLATVDDEYGVLNRTVIYRGLSNDNGIIYVTQRFTRNYKNLKANPKACFTFYWPKLMVPAEGAEPCVWQVRGLGATATELAESELDALWSEEVLATRIRALVFPCGEPVEYEELKAKHDECLRQHLSSGRPLERPDTYTAFKFQPERWDFLKAGVGAIADRVQYRRQDNGQWLAMHVAT